MTPCDRVHLDADTFQTMLDRLAHELRSPYLELARSLAAPLETVDVAGDVLFETLVWGDTDTRGVVGHSVNRRQLTLVNAGTTIITLGKAASLVAGAAGTFALLAGASITIATREPVTATGPIGSVLSFFTVEVAA